MVWCFYSLERQMKRSPIFLKDHDSRSYPELCYDPQTDCSKIVEEARKHATGKKLEPVPPSFRERQTAGHKSKKRSWKKNLFFWRKHEKKKEADSNGRRTTGKASQGCSSLNLRMLSVPSPTPRSKDYRAQGWFTPTRAEDTEVPYRPLDQRSNHSGVHAFGPIYSVT